MEIFQYPEKWSKLTPKKFGVCKEDLVQLFDELNILLLQKEVEFNNCPNHVITERGQQIRVKKEITHSRQLVEHTPAYYELPNENKKCLLDESMIAYSVNFESNGESIQEYIRYESEMMTIHLQRIAGKIINCSFCNKEGDLTYYILYITTSEIERHHIPTTGTSTVEINFPKGIPGLDSNEEAELNGVNYGNYVEGRIVSGDTYVEGKFIKLIPFDVRIGVVNDSTRGHTLKLDGTVEEFHKFLTNTTNLPSGVATAVDGSWKCTSKFSRYAPIGQGILEGSLSTKGDIEDQKVKTVFKGDVTSFISNGQGTLQIIGSKLNSLYEGEFENSIFKKGKITQHNGIKMITVDVEDSRTVDVEDSTTHEHEVLYKATHTIDYGFAKIITFSESTAVQHLPSGELQVATKDEMNFTYERTREYYDKEIPESLTCQAEDRLLILTSENSLRRQVVKQKHIEPDILRTEAIEEFHNMTINSFADVDMSEKKKGMLNRELKYTYFSDSGEVTHTDTSTGIFDGKMVGTYIRVTHSPSTSITRTLKGTFTSSTSFTGTSTIKTPSTTTIQSGTFSSLLLSSRGSYKVSFSLPQACSQLLSYSLSTSFSDGRVSSGSEVEVIVEFAGREEVAFTISAAHEDREVSLVQQLVYQRIAKGGQEVTKAKSQDTEQIELYRFESTQHRKERREIAAGIWRARALAKRRWGGGKRLVLLGTALIGAGEVFRRWSKE